VLNVTQGQQAGKEILQESQVKTARHRKHQRRPEAPRREGIHSRPSGEADAVPFAASENRNTLKY